MPVNDPKIINLLKAVELEEKEQNQKFGLTGPQSLKMMKAEGLALHPITVTRKTFGYADYPEITFHLRFPVETSYFRDGAAIECFYGDETPVKGVLLHLEGRKGEFRLFAPDFPDWIEEEGAGIKLAPDHRTTTIMKTVLRNLEASSLYSLFQYFHGKAIAPKSISLESKANLSFNNKQLNESQQKAVEAIVQNPLATILHGPPGTGKTTTLIEGIIQLIRAGEKVLVSAPSNAAVDHIARGLISKKLYILRLGNTSKVDELVFPHTPEGKLAGGREQKEIKQLKIRAEEFRKMAFKYKRSFGKAEREQRNLLFKEVKNIRLEIKKLRAYNEDKLFEKADVILGTPIGLYEAGIQHLYFKTLIIDEAGQCIEPLAWCIFPLADKIVLAGDHWQLPPTVLSTMAAALGLNNSILEVGVASLEKVHLLDTQYRMRASIAGFSGEYFYKGLLRTASHLDNKGVHLTFIDTAGSGYNEEQGKEGVSLENEGELLIVLKLLETESIDLSQAAFISPYSAQVAKAKQMLPDPMRLSTIDSFQGQESETVIISLVRSNDTGEIGFLKDYRRMNVAITRAKEQLFVIGDSATIGGDVFYNTFLNYVEIQGNYRSVWEFEM